MWWVRAEFKMKWYRHPWHIMSYSKRTTRGVVFDSSCHSENKLKIQPETENSWDSYDGISKIWLVEVNAGPSLWTSLGRWGNFWRSESWNFYKHPEAAICEVGTVFEALKRNRSCAPATTTVLFMSRFPHQQETLAIGCGKIMNRIPLIVAFGGIEGGTSSSKVTWA